MPKISAIINRFTFGEVSPLLAGRTDFSKYEAGARRVENFIPLVQGPLKRRGGTKFIGKTGNGDLPVALLRFEFSETVAYVIEVGHLYMRFYSGDGAVIGDDGYPYQVESPWRQQDIFLENGICALKQVQSGDVMYIVCPGQSPQKLARHGHTDWKIEPLPNWRQDPVSGTQAPKLRPNATAIALFRERLCLAAGQTVYMSASGAFEDFQLPGKISAADDPVEINIYSEQINKVEWLCPSGGLIVGTTGGEFIISENTSVDPLGPGNIKVTPETNYGSSSIQAMRVGSVILFVQRSGRKVRELIYDYSGDSYSAQDVSVAAEHITKSGLIALAFQSEPFETLWAARADGQLIGFTYNREQDMAAWHRHVLGGDGQVVSLAVIPATLGGRDELWLAVKREIGEETVYYIEKMTEGLDADGDLAGAFFVDSGISYRGEPTDYIFGLDHLEGETVSILADGKVLSAQMVVDGEIALEKPAKQVQAGLAYESVLTTLNLDASLHDGTIQGRLKRVIGAVLRLVDSAGGAVGPDSSHLLSLEYQPRSRRADETNLLFSGDTRLIKWPGGYETDGSLTVVQKQPLPLIVAAIMPDVILEGKN